MDKLVIEGGEVIQGRISASGAKNAVLPILAASLLFDDVVKIYNVPHLNDVTTMLMLLRRMGGRFTLGDKLALSLNMSGVDIYKAPYDLVKTMRASVLVLGPLLSRFGCAEVSMPGGCAIGSRQVDVHLEGMRALGAEVEVSNGNITARAPKGLRGAEIHLGKITVTGTENILMAAIFAQGRTVINDAACEPEVTDLANFLVSAGAKIEGIGSSTLIIDGVNKLNSVEYKVMPDRIEAGTYLVAAAITAGKITITNTCPAHMDSVLSLLQQAGAELSIDANTITLDMHGRRPKAVSFETNPYPCLPTDMQAQFVALNSVAEGSATVVENVFENRFMHVPEMKRMGANMHLDGNTVQIEGVDSLYAAPVMATDLRASASLVLAALVAKGLTVVDRIYHIDRGYECLEEKFRQLGINIYRAK
jgi:UDP-N-acetylglucosamine 1-carboxyvinyltransferase